MSGPQNLVPLEPPMNPSRAALLSSLRESDTHNVVAFLDTSSRNASSFSGIISYLLRSRIFTAISTVCPSYLSHQKEFWKNASVDKSGAAWVIKSTVFGRMVTVSADTIREVLRLGDVSGDPKQMNKYKVRGLFARCKYQGVLKEGIIMKSGLSPQFKYLAHVLQLCISPRRAGHDELGEKIEYIFAALVLNHPFDISSTIFDSIIDNLLTKQQPFLMYPRFLQMIINTQAPNTPKFDHDILKMNHMKDTTLGRMLVYKGKERSQWPVGKNLFGHLTNPAYVCPEKKKWRHDDSGSDDEGIIAPDSDDDDDEGDDGEEGGAGEPQVETASASADVGTGSGGIREEEAEKEKEKKKGKRKVVEEGVSGKSWKDFVVPRKKKTKLTFIEKPAASSTPSQTAQPATAAAPQPTTGSAPQAATAGGSSAGPSAPTSDEVQMLKNLLLKVMADQQALVQRIDDQDRLIKDQGEQLKSKDTEIHQLREELGAARDLMIGGRGETQRLGARVTTLEDFNASLEFDEGRVLRIKAQGSSSAAGAGDSSSSSCDDDTDSDSSSRPSRGGR